MLQIVVLATAQLMAPLVDAIKGKISLDNVVWDQAASMRFREAKAQ